MRGLKEFVDEQAPLVVPVIKQSRSWSCGPAALASALAYLGAQVTEAEAAELCGSDERGTSEQQLVGAVTAAGFRAGVIHAANDADGVTALQRAFDAGCPVIVCLDDWEHWATVFRPQGDGFAILQDPEHGTAEEVGADQLMRRWWCIGEGLYGVVVSHP